ncbi:sulfite exporter TauE/SafE family protein [Robiginitomaculum antarcticum]|uniref:sulfite exporter TauE/SafE family protein n=1 Tax=Robiginitomaculum antarcticum TaxID=437507 RepID=UPI00036BC07D|nr:sulfite exporter TauE/SafE family protein [Robiginitomaculum antarcticum]
MPLHLICLFFIVAALYAAVGFGGGSTYNALLVLHGTEFRILPTIALACNIIVVSGGLLRFSKEGLVAPRTLMPFLVVSIPAAWVGGMLPVTETVFIGILGGALFLSGSRLLLQRDFVYETADKRRTPLTLAFLAGGSIGLLSGIVGIGGGIFLAPVLYWLRWDTPRKIAAACSLFILANSISGLSGQIMKLADTQLLSLAVPYWPLLCAVFVGGQIGSWMASKRLNPAFLKRLTAVLILYVAARLIFKWLGLVGFLA